MEQNSNETPELFTVKASAEGAGEAAAPKRRTSRRVTANTEELKAVTQEAAEAPAKKTTRTRKTAAKATADSAAAPAEAEVGAAAAEGEAAAAAPAKKRATRTRKTAANAAAGADATAADSAAVGAGAESAGAEGAAAEGAAAAAATAPKRATRARRAKSTDATEAGEAGADSAAEKPARTRRSRKTQSGDAAGDTAGAALSDGDAAAAAAAGADASAAAEGGAAADAAAQRGSTAQSGSTAKKTRKKAAETAAETAAEGVDGDAKGGKKAGKKAKKKADADAEGDAAGDSAQSAAKGDGAADGAAGGDAGEAGDTGGSGQGGKSGKAGKSAKGGKKAKSRAADTDGAEGRDAGDETGGKDQNDGKDGKDGKETKDGKDSKDGERRGRRGRNARGTQQESAEQGEAEGAKGSTPDDSDGDGDGGQQGSRRDRSSRSRTRQRDRKRRGNDDEIELTSDDVLLPIAGILDVLDNYAFVRTTGYLPGVSDVYVSLSQVKRHQLRKGDAIVGAIRQPREGESNGRQKYNAIVKIDTINGQTPEEAAKRAEFDSLTPIAPEQAVTLSTHSSDPVARYLDLFAPVAYGQRGLIVSDRGGDGSAEVFSAIADGVSAANPDAHLMFVQLGGRPEDATALKRSLNGEVIAASCDSGPEDHITVIELALERAKRLVELGHDVVLGINSLNNIASALYLVSTPQQRAGLLGEYDTVHQKVLERVFGAARNVENGGSLTIYAGLDTLSGYTLEAISNWTVTMSHQGYIDDVFEALSPVESYARNSAKLQSPSLAAGMAKLRRSLADETVADSDRVEAREVLELIRSTADNDQFLVKLAQKLK